ncbi:hypothetical protein CTA2_3676, partial [Colletotrichum tanaceti]
LSLEDNDSVNLPQQIVLKKERLDNHDLFDNELRVYHQLQSLQGTIIPKYLGLATIDGVRALVLSDIGGISMLDQGMPQFDRMKLETMLAFPVRTIRQRGVHLGDLSMRNIHWCRDAFRFLDFEQAEILPEKADVEEEYVQDQVLCVSEPFQRRQEARAKMKILAKRRPFGSLRSATSRVGRHGNKERLRPKAQEAQQIC